ncbi:MAG: pilus (MSHA type) biogenesis protein MshL [Sulfurospirillum sp.]|nr:pilus (MSHA type) biogenesis protein MshL [Sulfurospirillum sp.]
MKKYVIIFLLILSNSFAFGNCENKLFTFTIKNQSVSILNVLENISDECQMSLIFEDNDTKDIVAKNVNYINIKDASLGELLELLLSQNDIYYELTPNKKTLKISYFKTKTFFIDYVSFKTRSSKAKQDIKTSASSGSGGSSDTGSGGSSIDFESEFKIWDQIQSEINYILSQGKSTQVSDVLINQDAGLLSVTGTKKQLDRVEAYLAKMMKRLHKEILVEAKVIEVQYTDAKTTGVDWSQFDLGVSIKSDAQRAKATGSAGTTTFQDPAYKTISDGFVNSFRNPNYLVGYSFSMDGLIKFLKTQGDVKIVSNPKIMTLNNQPAIINVGEEINYRYSTGTTTTSTTTTPITEESYESGSTFVGVTLDITPQVTDDNYIVLKINPIISEVSKENIDPLTDTAYLAPNVKIRQLSSIVKVKDGDKVLIGGLIGKKDSIDDTSVPVLSAIPLLGEVFKSSSKSTTRSEMIIVLIPHIVDGKQSPDLLRLDKSLQEEL